MQRVATWSLETHYLFPPGFRCGVKHVCGLKVGLDRAGRQLPNSLWMIIITYLPRDWAVVTKYLPPRFEQTLYLEAPVEAPKHAQVSEAAPVRIEGKDKGCSGCSIM